MTTRHSVAAASAGPTTRTYKHRTPGTSTPRSDRFVIDRWWPWRIGITTAVSKTFARVLWSNGEIWKYDRDHLKFLEEL